MRKQYIKVEKDDLIKMKKIIEYTLLNNIRPDNALFRDVTNNLFDIKDKILSKYI